MAKGRIISHYEIVEEIGRGGMGIVYKGRDRLLNRDVALKALPLPKSADAASDSRVARQRFAREAQSASALNHPNIVTIYDLLSEPDSDFIVMEYVDGKPLGSLIPPRGLPLDHALRYSLQIADAVSSAHAAGVIHRDLKPENILVTRQDQIKIVDFGLAKQGSGAGGLMPTQDMLTTPGSFLSPLLTGARSIYFRLQHHAQLCCQSGLHYAVSFRPGLLEHGFCRRLHFAHRLRVQRSSVHASRSRYRFERGGQPHQRGASIP